jgi:proline dehydrogenase
MAFVNATHNEESTLHLARGMHEAGVEPGHPNIHFSQLYGMGDNISYVLAKNGYNVTKYLPYGPVHDAVPYLIRRAEENTATAGQVSRELDYVRKEMARRGLA